MDVDYLEDNYFTLLKGFQYQPVIFIDDDPKLIDKVVGGVPVKSFLGFLKYIKN